MVCHKVGAKIGEMSDEPKQTDNQSFCIKQMAQVTVPQSLSTTGTCGSKKEIITKFYINVLL